MRSTEGMREQELESVGREEEARAAEAGAPDDSLAVHSAEEDPEGASASDLEAIRFRLEELERAAAAANDRFIRTLADFDNYRKRKNAEMEEARRYANERLVADLLPVLDSFDRALDSADSAKNSEALTEGMRLIQRQLQDSLKKAGLELIAAVGEPFDPAMHEAILQVPPGEGQEHHEVVEELRKGYRLNGRVVRAAQVKVTSG